MAGANKNHSPKVKKRKAQERVAAQKDAQKKRDLRKSAGRTP